MTLRNTYFTFLYEVKDKKLKTSYFRNQLHKSQTGKKSLQNAYLIKTVIQNIQRTLKTRQRKQPAKFKTGQNI